MSLWRQATEQGQKQKNYQDDICALWYPGISPATPFSSVTITGRAPAAGHNSPSHKTRGRITIFVPETTDYKTSSLVFKGIWNRPRATFLSWMSRRKLQRNRELMIQHACQDQDMVCGTHLIVRTKRPHHVLNTLHVGWTITLHLTAPYSVNACFYPVGKSILTK